MVDTKIVKQFARILAAMDGASRPTRLLGLDLASAPSDCLPTQLIVLQSDSDDLTLTSVVRDWWIVSRSDITHRPDWPLPKGEFGCEFHLASPCLRFATNGERIRYGLTLGPRWYCAMESRLVDFGEREDRVENTFEHKE